MRLSRLGICGIISLLSYTAMVVFNAVLGIYLMTGKFDLKEKGQLWMKRVED